MLRNIRWKTDILIHKSAKFQISHFYELIYKISYQNAVRDERDKDGDCQPGAKNQEVESHDDIRRIVDEWVAGKAF